MPPEFRRRAAASGAILSSTLLRSIQSAEHVAAPGAIVKNQLFCEAMLPYANWRYPRLPLSVWAVIFRLAWFCGYSSNAETRSAVSLRANSAAVKLIEYARQHGSVFLVGHGIMTMLIAKRLRRVGWLGPKRPANKYWQFGVYRSP